MIFFAEVHWFLPGTLSYSLSSGLRNCAPHRQTRLKRSSSQSSGEGSRKLKIRLTKPLGGMSRETREIDFANLVCQCGSLWSLLGSSLLLHGDSCHVWSDLLTQSTFKKQLLRSMFVSLGLGCCGSGKWPDSGKSPKVIRRGCKRSFGTKEQQSQKGLLHHQNLVLHRCNPAFHRCKRDLARLHPKGFCTLSQPLWSDFPESGDLPGPQLPNSWFELCFFAVTSCWRLWCGLARRCLTETRCRELLAELNDRPRAHPIGTHPKADPG